MKKTAWNKVSLDMEFVLKLLKREVFAILNYILQRAIY